MATFILCATRFQFFLNTVKKIIILKNNYHNRMPFMNDSSYITKRLHEKAISESFINRINNPIKPTTSYGPTLGISAQSIVNDVKNGQMTFYKKNEGGCITVSQGCPCEIPKREPEPTPQPPPPLQPGWILKIVSQEENTYNESLINITDSQNNIYVAGTIYSPQLTFYNSDGSIFTTITKSLSNTDIFLVKYNTDGFGQWVTRIANSSSSTSNKIGLATDSLNNVYISSFFLNLSLDVYNSDNSLYGTLPPPIVGNNKDAFIVKYNSAGFAQWATAITSDIVADDEAVSLIADKQNNIYVSGYYKGPATIYNFVNVTGTNINITPYAQLQFGGTQDVFIVKYNTNGQGQWSTRLSGDGTVNVSSIKLDNLDNIYIIGTFTSGNIFQAYNSDGTVFLTFYQDTGYLIKYNLNGIGIWGTRITATPNPQVASLITDSLNNVYVGGFISSTDLNIFNVNGTYFGQVPNPGVPSTYLIKYNSNGFVEWATTLVCNIYNDTTALSVDSDNNIYITGSYLDNLTINNFVNVAPGSPPQVITASSGIILTHEGGGDSYLVKYNSTNGQAIWGSRISGTGSEYYEYVAVDSFNYSIVSSYFGSNPLTIYNSDDSVAGTITNPPGASGGYLVKYKPNGFV